MTLYMASRLLERSVSRQAVSAPIVYMQQRIYRPGTIIIMSIPRSLTLLLVADAIVFSGTDAHQVAAWLLIVGFGLAALTAYWLIYYGLAVLRLYGIVIQHRRRLAVTLTAVLAGIVALQSAGGLNPKDILLILPLVIIGYSYLSYGQRRDASS